MLFRRYRNQRSAFLATMLACLAFIALAVWGWTVPLTDVLLIGLMAIGMVLVLIAMAALFIVVFRWLSKLRERG